ncbi:MAG: outer membrane protein assembly factor BamE [Alphaproteobacteria bacterium]
MRTYLLSGLLLFSALLSACASIESTHGQVVKEASVRALQPGVDTQETVKRALGSPSTTGTFDTARWYYLTETTESTPLKPNQLAERNLVVIDFDQAGKVSKVEIKTRNEAKDVAFDETETPTQGQSMGILDQLLGNLGGVIK